MTTHDNCLGSLALSEVTPVIRAIFGETNLGVLDPERGEVPLLIGSSVPPAWGSVFEELKRVATNSGAAVPEQASRDEILLALSTTLPRPIEFEKLHPQFDLALADSEECADSSWQELFALAVALNDGHDLTAMQIASAWHHGEQLPSQTGGQGHYIGTHYKALSCSPYIFSFASGIQGALQRHDVNDAAAKFAIEADELLSGVRNEKLRQVIRSRLSFLLAQPSASDWLNTWVPPEVRTRGYLSVALPAYSVGLLMEAIEATGGVIRVGRGKYAPKAAPDWTHLGAAYIQACREYRIPPTVAP